MAYPGGEASREPARYDLDRHPERLLDARKITWDANLVACREPPCALWLTALAGSTLPGAGRGEDVHHLIGNLSPMSLPGRLLGCRGANAAQRLALDAAIRDRPKETLG